MNEILWFREISEQNRHLAGEIGKNFGGLVNESFPVPPGFIVSSKALDGFLERNGLVQKISRKISSVNESGEGVERAANEIRALILKAPLSNELRTQVRSAYMKLGEKKIAWLTSAEEEVVSARVSPFNLRELKGTVFEKQKSISNLKGIESLSRGIKECWASLFRAEKIREIREKNAGLPKTAVIVQKMLEPDQSGVIYTNHLNGETEGILVKACYGVSCRDGLENGFFDRYVLERGGLKIVGREVNEQAWMIERGENSNEKRTVSPFRKSKQKIQDKTLVELAKIGKQIEAIWRKSQEVMFAIEKNQLFVLQTNQLIEEFEAEQEKPLEEKTEETAEKEKAVEPVKKTEEKPIELLVPSVPRTEFSVLISSPSEIWLLNDLVKEGAKEIVVDLDRFIEAEGASNTVFENQLKHLLKECREKNISLSVKGENSLDRELVKRLLGIGVKKVIASSEKIKELRDALD